MKRSTISSAVALALGAASMTAQAALTTSTTLQFDTGVGICLAGGTYPNCNYGAADIGSGSFFSMDTNGNGTVEGSEKVAIGSNNGIHIGTVQGATGSHSGVIDGSENPNIDNPWEFFGNTGMHQTTTAITSTGGGAGTFTLDFSGWSVVWNTLANIPMGGDSANFASDTGIATITCSTASCSDSSTYTLDYAAHVPLNDPSSFGGVGYALTLTGHVSAASSVPVPAAAWLFGSGLVGLAGVARRRKTRV